MRIDVHRLKSAPIAALFAVAALLGSGASLATAAADPTVNADPTVSYVALGDSYSSGLGLGDLVVGSPAFCDRSAKNFPHQVASSLDLRLTDVTCAGATTTNVISTPLKYADASAPVQSSALSKKTDLVTISIGGNDLGFVDASRTCVALGASGPLLLSANANCRSIFVKRDSDELLERLNGDVASSLQQTFAAIRRDAPNAAVFVVGYPTIFPDSEHTPAVGCFDAKLTGDSLQSVRAVNIMPFTDIDVVYLHSLEQALDDATSAAATNAGFTYISTLAATSGHSACAPSGERWINGVSIDRSKNGDLQLSSGSLHPDGAGVAFLAQTVEKHVAKVVTRARPTSTTATDIGSPVLPIALVAGLVVAAAVLAIVIVRRRRRPQDDQAGPPA